MVSDPIADMLTRIRNAVAVNKSLVCVTRSKINESIAEILKKKGFIEDFKVEDRELRIYLRYMGKKSVILGLERISKPGLRRYVKANKIPRVIQGLGFVIVSTPQGLMSGKEARERNLGGELICKIW